MPEMVIFDCDGVLIDSERLAVVLDVEMLAALGWPLTPTEVIERFMGRSATHMLSEIERWLGHPLPEGWTATGLRSNTPGIRDVRPTEMRTYVRCGGRT